VQRDTVLASLAAGSEIAMIEGAGHFLQLEKPAEVNDRVIGWVTAA
jgi:pimeloyl-ACP methyl ester carboxylesterase